MGRRQAHLSIKVSCLVYCKLLYNLRLVFSDYFVQFEQGGLQLAKSKVSVYTSEEYRLQLLKQGACMSFSDFGVRSTQVKQGRAEGVQAEEVQAEEVRAKEVRAKEVRAKEVRAEEVRAAPKLIPRK